MTKVDIFSGFLGAGKTTLIKKLIAEAYQGERLVLIENEFGDVGIDGGFMQEAGIQVTELNSGCICCTLVGDFAAALQEVLETYHPDRILIEPSGVGKLSDVIEAVRNLDPHSLFLNACVTVADASKCRLYSKNFGEFYHNQIEFAGAIVLSRTQELSAQKLEETLMLLRARNAVASIITTPWDALTGLQILEAMEGSETLAKELDALAQEQHRQEEGHSCHCAHEHDHAEEQETHTQEHAHSADCTCGHAHDHTHGHDADEIFQSWGLESARRFRREELRTALESLEDETRFGLIVRAKGIVPCTEGSWLHFDYVPGEISLREGSAAITGRLCVIGASLCEEAVAALFANASEV